MGEGPTGTKNTGQSGVFKDTKIIKDYLFITNNPQIIDEKISFFKSLISLSLSTFAAKDKFSVEQVTEIIAKNSKISIPESDIISIFQELSREGTIEHENGSQYVLLRKIEIPSFEKSISPVREEFEKYLTEQIDNKDYFSMYPGDYTNLMNIFNSLIQEIMSSFIFVDLIDSSQYIIPIEDMDRLIDSEIENHTISDKKIKKTFKKALIHYFTEDNGPQLKDLIYKFYNGVVRIDILKRMQNLPDICENKALDVLVLDASVIIALLCKTDPKHPLSDVLMKQCNQSKVELYYSSKTRVEIWNNIKTARNEIKGLRKKTERSSTINQFTVDFTKSKKTWDEYYNELAKWELQIKSAYSINKIPPEEDSTIDQDIYEIIQRILPIADRYRHDDRENRNTDYKPRLRTQQQYDNDSHCLALVAKMQKKNYARKEFFKVGPLFVTYDNLLTYINATNLAQYSNLPENKKGDIGFVIQPIVLLNYYITYSRPQIISLNHNEVAKAILQYTARLKSSRLSVEEYSKLVAQKINIDTNNIDALVELFYIHPLSRELKKALYDEDMTASDEVVYNIITDPEIDKFIGKLSTIDKKAEETKLSNLRTSIHKLKDEYDIERSKRENTEKRIEQLVNIEDIDGVDPQTLKKINGLILMMEADNIFSKYSVDKPPKRLKKIQFKEWATKVKKEIESKGRDDFQLYPIQIQNIIRSL